MGSAVCLVFESKKPDCPLEVAKERGLAGGQGWGIDETTVWLERRMPNNHDYFQKYRPDLRADLVHPTP